MESKRIYREAIKDVARKISLIDNSEINYKQNIISTDIPDFALNTILIEEHETRFLNSFIVSGIEFTSVSNIVKINDCTSYVIEGKSNNCNFTIVFDVLRSMIINSLSIRVSAEIKRDLEEFINNIEETRSLRTFFRGFLHYTEHLKNRSSLFSDLQKLRADLIHLEYGEHADALQFQLRDKPGLLFRFVWKVKVNKYGDVVDSTKLLPLISSEVAKADKLGLLLALPEQFNKLVLLLGVNAALRAVLEI